MTPAEKVFIFATSILLLILAIRVKNIPWKKLGFAPKSLLKGWWQVLLFNAVVFILIQLTISKFYNFIEFPPWMTDKDPIIWLLLTVLLQEIIFRGLIISWLERFGKTKALWISSIVFVLSHLVAPYTWSIVGLSFAGLTFIAGYFWGWHFLKFRNIYLLSVSHLLVNLSFNYVILNLV